jgi:hypothetical protein
VRCPSPAAEPECRLCGESRSESDQDVVVAVVRTNIGSGYASGVVNRDIPVLDGPDIPNSTVRSCPMSGSESAPASAKLLSSAAAVDLSGFY